jgi:hypothetical protein
VWYGFTGFMVERTAPQDIQPAPAQANDAASAKHAEAAD